ncbi:SemiSWEET family sugar transporter [Roseomonas sp. AR75]|uniref:SemiSWEET family sugar transporter n=1 Tax=Roseomonas sp. AR75 TaxID=2562311 RepID=UPI001F0D8C3F|nr:SemiSWEET transporter [Roseomonas sp. AR75]
MDPVELIGLMAGVLTTSAFVPQALQTWRTRSARDVNLGLIVLLVVGNSLWFAYGALVGSWGLVAANIVTVPLCMLILWVKLSRA